MKRNLQEEGVHNHALEQESFEISKIIEDIDGVPKGATSSFDSPSREGNKREGGRHKSNFNQISFDYVKHGEFPHKH